MEFLQGRGVEEAIKVSIEESLGKRVKKMCNT